MKKGHHKTGNAGANVWTTIPGFQGWPSFTPPADDDHRSNLSSQWKFSGALTRIPSDAKGEVITANKKRALVKWLLPVPLYGWIDREYLTAEPPQVEMQIDPGFALIVESADDGHRIAREKAAERERAEQAAKAQLSLF